MSLRSFSDCLLRRGNFGDMWIFGRELRFAPLLYREFFVYMREIEPVWS